MTATPDSRRIDMVRNITLVLAVCLLCQEAQARPRRQYTYSTQPSASTPAYSYTSSHSGSSDQERCQAEANYMAQNNITGHVWGCIGSFEGVGYGNSPNCNTCTPGSSAPDPHDP